MKTSKYAFTGLILLLLVLSGCNLPFSPSEPSIEEQAATFVAQTLYAPAPSQPGQTSQPPEATRPASSPTQNISGTPTGTITPTYSVPMLEVEEPTNCRSGPGQDYQIITTFQPGASAQIVGRYPENNWWLINNPFGTGTCWIWGEFATVSGSHWTVPSVSPPPPATEGLPAPPSIANWDFSCAYDSGGPNVTFNLKWSDRAVNESGYRIYRNEELVTELSPNSSSFSEVVSVEENEEMTYRLEVFNATGASSASLIRFKCQ
jgi:uncharacterized protein YraI